MQRSRLTSFPQVVDLALDLGQRLEPQAQAARRVGRTYHLFPADPLGTWSVFIFKGGLKEPLRPGFDSRPQQSIEGRSDRRSSSGVVRTYLAERLWMDLGYGPIGDVASRSSVDKLAEALEPGTALSIDAEQLHRYFIGARELDGVVNRMSPSKQRRLTHEPTDASRIRILTREDVNARTFAKVIEIGKLATRTYSGRQYSVVARVEQGGRFSNLDIEPYPDAVYGPAGLTYLPAEEGTPTGDRVEKRNPLYRLMAENMVGYGSQGLRASLEVNLAPMLHSLEVGNAIRFDVTSYLASQRSQQQVDPTSYAVVVPFDPSPSFSGGGAGLGL